MIFETLQAKDQQNQKSGAMRLSLDCKATVCLGEYSRGGQTRGDLKALDHDMGAKQKCIPCGILNEDSGKLHIAFGCSHKTSDFIVDALEAYWSGFSPQEHMAIPLIQIKVDNGPESSGIRTQFLKRIVNWVDRIAKPVQLLYFPPYQAQIQSD